MGKRLLLAVATLSLAAVVGVAAGRLSGAPVQEEFDPGPQTPPVTIQSEPLPVSRQVEGQSGVVELRVADSGFRPAVLYAEVGRTLRLHLKNGGSRPHNFILARFGIVTRNLEPGEENYIEFTASEGGEWPFFSDAPGRQEPEVVGILRVEAGASIP